MNINGLENRKLFKKWEEIDAEISKKMNSIYENDIEGFRKKYPKIKPERFDWIFCISKLEPELNNEDGENLIRHLSRIIYMIGFDLIKYENFVTDGGSGILLEHFLSEFLFAMCNQYQLPYVPPKEIAIAGGGGSGKRVEKIKEAFRFEGMDLSKPTLFITEFTKYAESMRELFRQIPDLQKSDYLSLGIYVKPDIIKNNFGLSENSKIFAGGDDVFFKRQNHRLGYTKSDEQTGAYLNAPDSSNLDDYSLNSPFARSRTVLSRLAERLLPILQTVEERK